MLVIITMLFLMGNSCEEAHNNSVTIYTGTGDFHTGHMQLLLEEQFPDYDITVSELDTDSQAAKLRTEGIKTEADIILCLETSYLESLHNILADLSSFDVSEFFPEPVPASRRFLPWGISAGTIAINRSLLESAGLPTPYTYQDLLNPIFNNFISMPNPQTSAAGYMFLISLINAWGEDEAFAYFDRLAGNNVQFTGSDSDTVNALIKGEAGIGLCMTLTAVNAINNHEIPLELMFYSEGAPFITTGIGIIRGKENRPVVREVFTFILRNRDTIREVNTIPFADMDGIYDAVLKEQVLARWTH